MIKLERTSVMNIENAIRGMRNPLNSWDKGDSCFPTIPRSEVRECINDYDGMGCIVGLERNRCFRVGPNDLNLAQRLCNAGSDHRKFLRQIFVSIDITAPLYWWKEYDTYKVGTTANSCSTMHKLHSKPITLEDFSFDNSALQDEYMQDTTKGIVSICETLRVAFIETKDKEIWRALIQLLPSSYNQLRTCTMTYENLRNMYHSRKNHKLSEWHSFCEWVNTLPYAKELIVGENTKK